MGRSFHAALPGLLFLATSCGTPPIAREVPKPLPPAPRAPISKEPDGHPAPPPEAPKAAEKPAIETPAEVVASDHELPLGCFAWSESTSTAACVIGGGSIQQGERFTLEFLGPKARSFVILDKPPHDFSEAPFTVKAADKAEVIQLLAGFERLGSAALELDPNGRSDVDTGWFAVRWVRNKVRHVAVADGSWDVFADRLEVRCANHGRFAAALTGSVEGPLTSSGSVWIEGGRFAVLERRVTFGIEGDQGGSTQAKVIDVAAICPIPGR